MVNLNVKCLRVLNQEYLTENIGREFQLKMLQRIKCFFRFDHLEPVTDNYSNDKKLVAFFALCRKNPFADLSFDASAWRQNRFSATTTAHLICVSTFEAENDVIAFWTCWWFHFSSRTAGIRVGSSPKAFELKVEPWRARTSQCFPSSLLWVWVKFELALQAPAISNNLELEKCQGHFHHSNNFAKLKPNFFNLDRAQKRLAMLLKTRLEQARAFA